MASTDYPLSVSSKFIDNAGTEHLVTVRGRNLEDFRGRLTEAGNIFPYAGFAHNAASVATNATSQVTEEPTPIPTKPPNPVAATADQATINANTRAVEGRVARKAAAPSCPQHQRKMIPSKYNDGFYCPTKDGDTYCQHSVAA